MIKEYTALGLMSGTSGDGVDASIIQSDGQNKYKVKKTGYVVVMDKDAVFISFLYIFGMTWTTPDINKTKALLS